MAFQDAAKKAKPVLLEPVMRLEVSVPNDYTDDVIANLRIRRGEIQSQDTRGGMQLILARVPLSEMFGYATDLRSRTQGRATYAMHFDRYDPRSPDDSEGPDDPLVREPHRPTPPSKSSRVALPEPNAGNDELN